MTRKGRVALAALSIAAAIPSIALAGTAPAPDPQRPVPTCRGSAKALDTPGPAFKVRITVRCAYLMTRVTIKTSRAFASVGRHAKIRPADAGKLDCTHPRPKIARCTGTVDTNARTRATLRLRSDPCSKPKLRIQATAVGGPDCNDGPCPAIGYADKIAIGVPNGC